MALDSTASQAEDDCPLALGFVKDRRLLTGSADEVHLSPTDLANSDQIGLSPTSVPMRSHEIPLLINHPPGSAEEGHGFGFVTTNATAGSEPIGLVATTPTAGWEEEDEHGLVTPMSLSSSNLNECLLGSVETQEDEKVRLLTRDRRGI